MPGPEIQIVSEIMRANPIFAPDRSVEEMRANMRATSEAMELPADVAYEPVVANGVPCEWTTAPEASAGRVVLYAHGGGYVIGGIETHRLLVAGISRAAGARVLSVDYRLAPEHRYPCAVEDLVTAYRFLLESGIDPASIAIAGDSAGGGLTAATLIALRDAGEPLPGAAVLISPWLDLTGSGESMKTRASVDPVCSPEGLAGMAAAYLGDADPKSATASPVFADLGGLPPILVHVGTEEILLDDSRLFARRAREAGVDVSLEEWEGMIHVWHAFAVMLPEGEQAILRIGDFLRERLR